MICDHEFECLGTTGRYDRGHVTVAYYCVKCHLEYDVIEPISPLEEEEEV
jgi:hypothetical protein